MALSRAEVEGLGLAAVGRDVAIHETALFFGAPHVTIGSHVRIDSYAIVTAGPGAVTIGDHVHVSAGAQVFGTAGVTISDLCSISARVSIFSVNDDYVEGYLTNPTVPIDLRNVTEGPVAVGRHVVIGAGSVVLPGVEIGEGGAVGALSLVARDVAPGSVVAGTPARHVRQRDTARLRELEAELRARI